MRRLGPSSLVRVALAYESTTLTILAFWLSLIALLLSLPTRLTASLGAVAEYLKRQVSIELPMTRHKLAYPLALLWIHLNASSCSLNGAGNQM